MARLTPAGGSATSPSQATGIIEAMTSTRKPWIEVDKRIRERLTTWTKDDEQELAASLAGLPDVSAKAEFIEIEQPAIGSKEAEEEAAAQEDQSPAEPAAAGSGG